MNNIIAIFKREFFGYFRSPVAFVFLAVFVLFFIGIPWFLFRFYESGNAELTLFFDLLPWIYLFLIPSVGMRLWSEEKRSGTWELLLTLPVSVTQAVIGKFLAGWLFIVLALALTFTLPLTVAYLGNPDWGPIIAGYLGAAFMGGAYLGICSLTSSLTKNQVISFVISVLVLLIMLILGLSAFANLLDFLPVMIVDAVSNFSFYTHFETIKQGLIRFENLVFFGSVIFFSLCANIVILER